jgi:hypothetical protein
MKYIFLILTVVALNGSIMAQQAGTWAGTLSIADTKLKLAFELFTSDSNGKALSHSPDQNAYDLPARANWQNDSIYITIQSMQATYKGKLLNDSTIQGEYKQGMYLLPLTLIKTTKISAPKRPQHPIPPFNYYTEDVVFENTADSILLAGTLVLPKKEGVFPIVVLVNGSGPQDRNSEIIGHKIFLVVADYFAKQGIGSLRYDDRGVGKSKGNFAKSTSMDFAKDAEAAVNYLSKRAETKSIGIVGHSEGGLIAPIVAARNKSVNYIVLLAGPGVSGDKILLEQSYLIAKVQGATNADEDRATSQKIYEIIRTEHHIDSIKNKIFHIAYSMQKASDTTKTALQKKQETQAMVYAITTPWMLNFIRYNPADNLKKVTCPVLAANGDKDLQVPADINLKNIKKLVKSNGNKKVTIKKYKNLNHLFQTTNTGNPAEYGKLEETFNEQVMKDVAAWILKQRVQ